MKTGYRLSYQNRYRNDTYCDNEIAFIDIRTNAQFIFYIYIYTQGVKKGLGTLIILFTITPNNLF